MLIKPFPCKNRQGAILLGKELAKRQITLIYGGASVGIMATVANTVLEEGGKVIGVIPTLLEEREIAHQQLTELIVQKNICSILQNPPYIYKQYLLALAIITI